MSTPNTLIIGDIHSNFGHNHWRIEKAIEDYDPSHIIFLGDYVDQRFQNGQNYDNDDVNDVLVDLHYLSNWIQSHNTKDRHITCLIGNHDWAYISSNTPTTQTINEIAPQVKEEFDKINLQLVSLASYRNDNEITKDYICSHAGLCQSWIDQFFPNDMSTNTINKAFYKLYKNPEQVPNILELISKHRGWVDPFSSPIWCDLKELFLDMPNLAHLQGQIIGHTNVNTPYNILDATGRNEELWVCDTSKTNKCGLLMLEEGKPQPFALDYTDEELDPFD